MIRVVSDTLDDPQALGFTLPEQDSIARGQEFRTLDESEGNKSPITGSYEGAVNVDDRASLTHCADVQHCLIPRFDCCSVGENENFLS
jgi:hypothetical protein